MAFGSPRPSVRNGQGREQLGEQAAYGRDAVCPGCGSEPSGCGVCRGRRPARGHEPGAGAEGPNGPGVLDRAQGRCAPARAPLPAPPSPASALGCASFLGATSGAGRAARRPRAPGGVGAGHWCRGAAQSRRAGPSRRRTRARAPGHCSRSRAAYAPLMQTRFARGRVGQPGPLDGDPGLPAQSWRVDRGRGPGPGAATGAQVPCVCASSPGDLGRERASGTDASAKG